MNTRNNFLKFAFVFLSLLLPDSVKADYWVTPQGTKPDGDTHYVARPVRLYGVDTPEKKQPFGPESLTYAQSLMKGRTVRTQCEDSSSYNRTVCRIIISSKGDLGALLVQEGLAWVNYLYLKDDEWYGQYLLKQQILAKELKRGIWSLPPSQQIAPWEYRKQIINDNEVTVKHDDN